MLLMIFEELVLEEKDMDTIMYMFFFNHHAHTGKVFGYRARNARSSSEREFGNHRWSLRGQLYHQYR